MMLQQCWLLLGASSLLGIHDAAALATSEIGFDPFGDAIPYTVVWPGPAPPSSDTSDNDLSTRVKTADNENYVCTYEHPRGGSKAQTIADYAGPSAGELLQSFFAQNTCSYRIESYWAYELCHGRHFRQYHETKDATSPTGVSSVEYFLGFYKGPAVAARTESSSSSSGSPSPAPPTLRFDGEETAYHEVTMEDGTACDLNGKPRRSRVFYICHPDGRGEVYELTETSSCEYRVLVLTAALCQHPAYRKDQVQQNVISCYALSGAPTRPRSLVAFDGESERWRPYNKPQHKGKQQVTPKGSAGRQKEEDDAEEEEEEEEEEGENEQQSQSGVSKQATVTPDGAGGSAKPTSAPQPPLQMPEGARTDVGSAADEALLSEFLSGSYCIQGGSGWWQHEFCFGRHALQFHPESGGRRSDIVLGRWDEAEHLSWLKRNPSKRPKPRDKRKAISLFYMNGDMCDLTGKPRVVEVKLKCAVNAGSSHYVSVYLLEPKTCEYIMTIESPILCKVVAQADENGIYVAKP